MSSIRWFKKRSPRSMAPIRALATALWFAGAMIPALFLLPSPASAAPPKGVVHIWKRLYYGHLDGQESLLFAGKFDRAKPALADIDGDGDLDLFLGRGDGRVMFFQNQGSRSKPLWRLVNEAVSAAVGGTRSRPGALRRIDVGENAAPALTDIDGDGDLDLMVGSASGKLFFYLNEGNRFLATFRLESPDFLGKSIGFNLVVKFPDLNKDGLPDLSTGNEAGDYAIALNQGTRSQPRYCLERTTSPECLSIWTKLGRLHPEDNAVPEWVDWDGDGDLDLLIGKSDGTVAYLQNIGDSRKGAWEPKETRFQILDAGGYAAPLFADLNGDGVADLLLAGDGEKIAYYSRRKGKGSFPLWSEDKNVLHARRLGGFQTRMHVAAGDLDGDGDLDLILGTRNGRLVHYENDGSGGKMSFRSPQRGILPTPQRAFSAPALVDIDGDGDLDLIVGGRDGRLEWIENSGTPRQPRWKPRSLFFATVDVGALSVPFFTDLDGDNDPDLLVGNSLGNVIYYENKGSPKRPNLVLSTVRFASLSGPANASPALFPWSPKGAPDLVVGNQAGTLVPAIRNVDKPVAEKGGYQPQSPWAGLRASDYSAPLFADFTGDGRPDLLLGTGEGTLLFWRYEGNADPTQVAARGGASASNSIEERLASTFTPLRRGEKGEAREPLPGAEPTLADILTQNLPLDPIFVYEPSVLEKLPTGPGTIPAFFDHNGDGRPDLVIGTRAGKLLLFENGGDANAPTWTKIGKNFAEYNHGRNAAPYFADVDADGDLDLVVGNERGRVNFWENSGSATSPRFTLREKAFSSVRVGSNAVPAFSDLNGDGRLDLLVGNLKGQMQYYQRQKNGKKGFSLVIRRFIGLDVGINASPTFSPLTGKDRSFLLMGSDNGRVFVYAPTGTSRERSSGWKENTSYLDGLKLPPGSHPAVADIDGDGDVDLVIGSDKGPLLLFRNNAKQPALARAAAGK